MSWLCGSEYSLHRIVARKRHRYCCFQPWRCSEVRLYSCGCWIQRRVCLSRFLKIMSQVNAGWCWVVSAQVKLFYEEVLVKMLQHSQHPQWSVLPTGWHSSKPDVTHIYVNGEPCSWLWTSKNRSSTDGLLYSFEGGLHFWSPHVGLILGHEFGQWFHNVGETRNKPPVITARAKDATHFMSDLRSWPFPHSFLLLWVGGYPQV